MRNVFKIIPVFLMLSVFIIPEATSQGLLKKAAKKLQKDAEKMLIDDDSKQANPANNPVVDDMNGSSYNNNSSGGEKTKMTPPDVKNNLSTAESSLKTNDYNKTRFALQQALIGVELEIGYEVLNSLPKELNGNKYEDQEDHITSTGVGFAGLHIERSFYGESQYVNVSILNNSTMMGMYSGAISTPGYTDESQKSVMVGDYRGVLEASAGGHYSLGIPFGQSSLLMMRFDEFKNENEVLKCAEKIDLTQIKELLGEQ